MTTARKSSKTSPLQGYETNDFTKVLVQKVFTEGLIIGMTLNVSNAISDFTVINEDVVVMMIIVEIKNAMTSQINTIYRIRRRTTRWSVDCLETAKRNRLSLSFFLRTPMERSTTTVANKHTIKL